MTEAEKRITYDPKINNGRASIRGIAVADILRMMSDRFASAFAGAPVVIEVEGDGFKDIAAVLEHAAFVSDVNVRVGLSVFVWKEGRLLLQERQGSHGAGLLAVPGGHQDFGETFLQSALRELKEEAGPDFQVELVRVGPPADIMEFLPLGKQYLDVPVVVRWVAGDPKVMEPNRNGGWRWVTPEELEGMRDQLFPTVLERVQNGVVTL